MECQRCGNCCITLTQNDFWKTNLDEFQKAQVQQAIGYKCDAYVIENGVGICLVEKLLGAGAKPKECRDYFCEKAKGGSNESRRIKGAVTKAKVN